MRSTLHAGSRVQGLGFRVYCLGFGAFRAFRVTGLLAVQLQKGLGLSASGLGIWGSGFRV